jgi:UDP-glucose 4-epimerase
VEALLLAGAEPQADGEVYNLGGEAISLVSLADLLIDVNGAGSVQRTELPPERRAIDPGKVYLSYEKIRRELGWEPRVDLRDGMARTLAFYRAHRDQYWDAAAVAEQQVAALVSEGSRVSGQRSGEERETVAEAAG